MTPKQLANVLVKVLGLSLAVQPLPDLVYRIITIGLAQRPASQHLSGNFWMTIVYSVTLPAIGIWMIAYSQRVTGWLFNRDEP